MYVSVMYLLVVSQFFSKNRFLLGINRIHRIGQQAKIVRIRRFIVNDSVEERILELQNRKKYIADEIYNTEMSGNASGAGTARLGLDDFKLIFKR